MARPQKQTVDYFPHLVNQGKTIFILENEFGNDGYAFWFKLLELLCTSDGQTYDYNSPSSWRFLLAKTHVTEDTATAILTTLVDVGAIDEELNGHKIIWVQHLVDNLELVYNRRTDGKPQKPSYNHQEPPSSEVSPDINEVSTDINPQTIVHKTKQNKTKGEKRQASPPALLEIGNWRVEKLWGDDFYAELKGNGWMEQAIEDEVKRCIDYWDDQEKKGKKCGSPKNALRNWFNSEAALKRKQRDDRQHGGNPDRFLKGKYGHMVQR